MNLPKSLSGIAIEKNALAVVVAWNVAAGSGFLRTKETHRSIFVKRSQVQRNFGCDDLRFADVVVLDVAAFNGEFVAVNLRCPTDAEFQER
jgi:cold shock CspA family protein